MGRTRSPWRSYVCCLPPDVTRSAPTLRCFRGCINLRGDANSPAAWSLPCVRFADAVPPAVMPRLSAQLRAMILVTRQSPAIFDGLANICATLGSYYWLGFVTTGLSPAKKRLALLGAQRQSPAARCGQRASIAVLKVKTFTGNSTSQRQRVGQRRLVRQVVWWQLFTR